MQTPTRPGAHRGTAFLPRLGLATLLAGALTAGVFLARYGPAAMLWDESEYAAQAVDTAAFVASHGLWSWPGYIAHRQNFGKPPLLVNTLAVLAAFTGPSHIGWAAGALASATAALLAFVVYRSLALAAAPRLALLGAMALMSTPGVAWWEALAYPDLELTAITVAAIALIAAPDTAWRWPRAVSLGVLLGLGMLAKASFPMFAGPPLLYWLLARPWGAALRARLRAAAIAAATAVPIAALWYAANWRDALTYARFAQSLALDPSASRWQNLRGWLTSYLGDGIGYVIPALLLAAAAAAIATRHAAPHRVHRRPQRLLVLALAGSVPALVYFLPGAWPNSRHPLPALVLLALALVLLLDRALAASRHAGALFRAALLVVAAQWLVVNLAATTLIAWRPATPALAHAVDWFAPSLWRHPTSDAPVTAALSLVEAGAAPHPRVWYVSGQDARFNLPRLALVARLRNSSVRFDLGCYYLWPLAQCLATLARARSSGAGVMTFDAIPPEDEFAREISRHSAAVETFLAGPAQGWRITSTFDGGTFRLRLYQPAP